MTRYRYFLLSSVLQFPYSFNVQQYQFFFAPPSPRLCPHFAPYIENPAAAHDSDYGQWPYYAFASSFLVYNLLQSLSDSVTPFVTNIYLEASSSSTYIQDGFKLLLPIIQLALLKAEPLHQQQQQQQQHDALSTASL